MILIAWIGMALTALGALALYAASPNQLLLTARLPVRRLSFAGWTMLAAALIALLQWAGPATSVFIGFTLAMLVWSVVPAVAAWLRGDRKKSR